MFDWVGLLLKVVYYYGHLIGLSNFEFEWTGRVFKTRRSALYAIAIDVILVILIVLQISKPTEFNLIFGKANKLHHYVIIIVFGLRVVAGLSTVFIRWSRRKQMMLLAKKVLGVFLKNPHLRKISRWGILIKVTIAIVTDLLQMAINWNALGYAKANQTILMALQFWVSAIVNLAVAQRYLLTLFVRAHYHLLNTELRQVIKESRMLSYHPQRRGAFMTRCCSLADQVESIAKFQSELQSIVNQLDEVFGIQGLMVYFGYYIFSIATAYITYSILKNGHENLELSVTSMILSFTWCFFYFLDAILNLFNTLNLLEDHTKMIRLLEERTLFAFTLDVRLEQSVNFIQLQLIRNPFKMEIMKFFPITRSSTTAMFGSLITHSIFLIQYDMEYF
ncbi:putative gustatory receptor 36a [Drosophila takahashii]|uniref:putative gustatory receptor 36a n=1 Tax=Drosophila takahashii TaxID=29030 RepID=UPI001CF8FE1F|nr:putative gustatory receptor 36a [Drosophila takahashii]